MDELRDLLSVYINKANITRDDVSAIKSICDGYVSNCGFPIFLERFVSPEKTKKFVVESVDFSCTYDNMGNVRSCLVIPTVKQ